MGCDKGNTALHDKAANGDIDGVKDDVAKGANTAAKNEEGKTPSEVASNAVISAALNSSSPATDAHLGSFAEYVMSRPRQDFSRADFNPQFSGSV